MKEKSDRILMTLLAFRGRVNRTRSWQGRRAWKVRTCAPCGACSMGPIPSESGIISAPSGLPKDSVCGCAKTTLRPSGISRGGAQISLRVHPISLEASRNTDRGAQAAIQPLAECIELPVSDVNSPPRSRRITSGSSRWAAFPSEMLFLAHHAFKRQGPAANRKRHASLPW
jgi:hypothetical protein